MLNTYPAPHLAALKIWFAGLVTGPVFYYIGMALYGWVNISSIDSDVPLLWGYMVFYGGLFSLPSLGLLWLALKFQGRFGQVQSDFWVTILAITLLLTAAPFLVLGFFLGEQKYFFGYIAAYLGGIWLGVYWAYSRVKFELPSRDDEPLDANV